MANMLVNIQMKTPRVIDAFTYLNEEELVRCRLEYLKDVVTDFIVIESNLTWRHKPTEPTFHRILETLPEEIKSKVHHVVVNWPDSWIDDEQGVNEKWVENGTREHAYLEIHKWADPDDWFIMNDLDEFWDPSKWDQACEAYKQHGQIAWVQDNRVCFVDWQTLGVREWPGSKQARVKDVKSIADFYCSKNKSLGMFHGFVGGWHFSKMGDEATKAKLMGAIREWRTWETKIGMTADQAAKEIFSGGGWNRVSKKKKTYSIPVGNEGLPPALLALLKQYPVLWSNGRLPNNGRSKYA